MVIGTVTISTAEYDSLKAFERTVLKRKSVYLTHIHRTVCAHPARSVELALIEEIERLKKQLIDEINRPVPIPERKKRKFWFSSLSRAEFTGKPVWP